MQHTFTLVDPDGLAEQFLNQWMNESTFIEARTSGSTGEPKTIRLLKQDMILSAKATCSFFRIDSSSVMLCPLSTDYIAGKMMIVRAYVSGATLIVVPPSTDFYFTYSSPIDLLPIVPSQMDRLCSSPQISNIRNVIIGGAPLDSRHVSLLHHVPFKSFATFGMTETCSHVALAPIVGPKQIFQALPGFTFDVDSENCLIIEAPEFSFSPLITNDIVRLIDSTRFIWIGRRDNVINSGGIKFFPETIEKLIEPVIKSLPSVSAFYIGKRSSLRWGEEIILYLETDSSLDQSELMDKLRSVLPDRKMMPKDIVCCTSFLRTRSGKIRRNCF